VKLSLRTKATLLVTTLVVGLLAGIGMLQSQQLGGDYLDLLARQQDALAESVADDLADKLELHLSVLEQSGELLGASTLADVSARHRFLAQVSPARTLFDGVAIVSLDGEVVANDPPHPPGTRVNIRDRPYFRQLLASGRATISMPLQSRAGSGAVVLMAAPVRDAAGRMIAVVGGGLQLQRGNLFGQLAQAPVGRTGRFEIVTRGATPVYVVHPDPAKLLTAAAPVAANGDIVTRKLIRGVDWELRVVLPAWEAAAPASEARQRLVWQLGGLALIAALLIWLGMQWLLRPLSTLHVAIRTQRETPGAPLTLETAGQDERGDLAREFVALMHTLDDRQAELGAVLQASPLGLFRVDTHGHMVFVNDSFRRIHGLTSQESGDAWIGLVRAEIRSQVEQAWRQAVQTREVFAAVRRLTLRDGQEVLLSIRGAPLVVGDKWLGHVGTVEDITERASAEKSRRVLTTIFDSTTDYVVQTDRHGGIRYMNPAARRAIGVSMEAPVAERNFAEFNTPATTARFTTEILPAVRKHGVWLGETTVYLAGGREVPISHMVIAHRDTDGRIDHYSAVMRDISAAVEAERAVQRQAATLRSVTEAIPAIVAVVGRDGRYRFVNSAFERWRETPRERILGRSLLEVLGPEDHLRSQPWVDRVLAGETVSFERDYSQLEASRYLAVTYIPLRMDDGRVDGFVGVAQDITQHRREEVRLLQLTQRDALTGLLNRAGFEAHLAERLREGAGPQLALLYVDLDHFKSVNDTHGHPIGDRLLQMFGQRLCSLVRPTDAVARLGGDEFAIVLAGVREAGHARRIADKVIDAAAAPFEVDALELRVGASVGMAIGVLSDGNWRDLVARADSMLYQAKQSGRGRHVDALH
jgi:diguanylate cyclase (GGDEF)-like protein/PAS domain S-box-containing protein